MKVLFRFEELSHKGEGKDHVEVAYLDRNQRDCDFCGTQVVWLLEVIQLWA